MRSAGDVIQLVLSHERNIPKVNIVLAKINFATIALVGCARRFSARRPASGT